MRDPLKRGTTLLTANIPIVKTLVEYLTNVTSIRVHGRYSFDCATVCMMDGMIRFVIV